MKQARIPEEKAKTANNDRADWTVMVYLAGDNSLTEECVYSLNEMRKAARNEEVKINVIAQFDPDDPYLPTSRLNILKRDARTGRLGETIFDTAPFRSAGKPRFHFESNATRALNRKIEAARQKSISNARKREKGLGPGSNLDENEIDINSADPGTLFDFISLGIEKFRAKRYMVILSGHGAGTEDDFLLKDNSSGEALSIPNLRRVFEQIQKDFGKEERDDKGPVIDILGMDACCMSMAEVVYELEGLVDTVVASESYSPAAGWPYREILQTLEFDHFGSTPSEFAKAIVDKFVNFYADYTLGGLSVDQAALRVTQADLLKKVVRGLARALTKEIEADRRRPLVRSTPTKSFKDALVLAHWEAQSYSGELFVDLLDFCECLKKHFPVSSIRRACTEVINVIESKAFVLRFSYSGPVFQYSHGVSIYFPWAIVAPSYSETRFAKETGWGTFLGLYTDTTRRDVRVDARIAKRLSQKTKFLIELNGFVGSVPTNGARSQSSGGFRQVGGRQVGGRQVGGKQVGGKGSENPIISMRNPPIVYLPDRHIHAIVSLIKVQGLLFFGEHRRTGPRKLKR